MVLDNDYEITLISEREREDGDNLRTYRTSSCSTPREAMLEAERMNPGYRSFHSVNYGRKLFMSFIPHNKVMFSGLIVEDGPSVTIKAQDGVTVKATIKSEQVRAFAVKGSLIIIIGSIGGDGNIIAEYSQVRKLTKEERKEWERQCVQEQST